AEREAKNLRRELEELRLNRATGNKALEEAERHRSELQREVENLRASLTKAKPTAAAAAAPPPSSSSSSSSSYPPPAPLAAAATPSDAPKWLVLRARSDLCEIKSEAASVESNNGFYTLIPGGLAEALKDSGGQRAAWPLSGTVWKRSLPQARWLYSSKKGVFKVTDGLRDDRSFNLAMEVDEGSTFEALVHSSTPHNNAYPHQFTGWCKGVTVDVPPEVLHVVADKTASTGKYSIVPDKVVNGWPVWHLPDSTTRRWLYNTPDGSWQIADSEAEFVKGGGLLIDAKHNGVLPHLVSWEGGITVSM
ncbi:hypothetical protein DIPPA_30175, partial [Diplonema papillatum]